ncbi:neutral/alkaline non-lysosomal ceramidase N-terminal domain-containing protein [Tundrisphaera sp. TA3]|uniref:neutral/alkaline non-lysosomal ceramidase N-terminal domain-containing protein n=1 Tax=Tundrisphaera sp. TA3 TaxID=3435775 RepID=UPI003EBCAFA2
MPIRPALLALAACLAPLLARPALADDTIPIGVARADVTPEGPIWLSGYLSRTAESNGVAQKIWAKALAIGSDEQGPAILVSLDSLGISAASVAEVAGRLERKAGIKPERLSIAASHTHYAPCLTDVAPHIFGKKLPAEEQARVDAYTRTLVDRLEKVCLDALADRAPGQLSWSQGKVGFAANRRTKGGPVDHALPVLRVTAPDGKIRAILTNYACHCTTIPHTDNLVHGDWAGVAQEAIEADHPGCIALTVVGCGADSNPTPRGSQAMAESYGRSVADEVARLLKGSWADLPAAPPAIAVEKFSLPFDTLPDREALEKLVKAGGPPGYNASVWLSRLDRGEKLPEALPYSAQAWRFGDKLAMVFLPGEVVVDYVLRLKKELDPARLWVSAYSNDAPCYIPSERILREGGYEGGGAMVYYGWPTRLKPGVEDLIDAAVLRVVGPGFEAPKAAEPPRPPLTPEQGRAAWRVKPGFRVELVAAEPLVESPVAVDFGVDGKLWVCEMRDYPMGIANDWKPGGVVKVLEDRDGDGRYETATKFLDGLPFPTGVMAWRKGVIVCAAPEVIYAEDTDGDGRADIRRSMLQGFATENYQARVNGLSYGLDNWVYGANGLIGGTIRGMANGSEVNIGGRDFRMKPDTGAFEPASGLTQQGRVRDDWGNPFGGNNSVLIQHFPLPDHYARRNPRVAPPAPAVNVVRDADPARIYPASETVARFNHPESANRVTSACSPLIYRDDYLGKEFTGNSFTCEPVHNLVRRAVLTPEGATFAGHRAPGEEESEFLASTDPWCRPVQVRTGPDGALWVADMYRAVVEHPRWISPETLKTIDVRAGATMGRIYRVVAEGRPTRPVARLESLQGPELARAIDTPNGTVRDNVQRLLVHRGDRSAAPTLVELAKTSTHPEARLQALATLDGLGVLDPDTLLGGLADAHPGVRREAIRMAESRFTADARLLPAVIARADDPDAPVRFQAALSLGESTAPEAGAALGRIAARDGADRWILAAVLSSATPHAPAILAEVAAKAGEAGPAPALVEPLVATIAGSGNPADIRRVLGLLRVVDRGPEAWKLGALARLLDARNDPALAADPDVAPTLAVARAWAADRSRPAPARVAALRLLGRGDRDADREVLSGTLEPSEPADIQAAAIQGLARIGDRPAADAVLAAWSRFGPANRGAALDALLAREATAEAVVDALEKGRIAPTLVDAAHRERLLGKGTEDHRNRVARVFGPSAIGPRKAVVAAYASARTLPGDANRGARAFARACASCHKVGEVGHEVGPDLMALTDTSPDALLGAILDPNAEVDARYAVYTAALKDGRVLAGLIASETAGAITLKRQDGAADAILRVDLEDLATAGKSLMPEGLENDLTPADMADLIAFLNRGGVRPKELAGNRPRPVVPDADGTLRLTADAAEVYGPSLVFEPEFANLGYWHTPRDRAAWTFHLDRPTTFSATLDSACDEEAAGNAYEVRAGATTLRGRIAGTSGWSDYRPLWIGEIPLPAGDHRIEIRPAGPIRVALADIRSLTLVPKGLGSLPPPATPAPPELPTSAADRAAEILNPKTAKGRRDALLAIDAAKSAELLSELTKGLDPADHTEESRRIPWIWQVAIAAGRRNDAAEIVRILDASTPADSQPLERWQAVAIGGGIINGITQAGEWPGARVEALLRDDPARLGRWRRALGLAFAMADDASVPSGTRYDALRMIGLEPWDKAGAPLSRYLAPGTNGELQQGAVSALGDLPDPRATRALLDAMGGLTPSNRKWALEALVRNDERRAALRDALKAGQVKEADLPDGVRSALGR